MDKTAAALAKLGVSEKETAVYKILLIAGPSSVRKISEKAGVNRGTVYECLKALQSKGLITYYHKEKHQYFVAEDPANLERLVKGLKSELQKTEEELKEIVPQLRLQWSEAEERPVVKYYENYEGVRAILENVLQTVSETKEREYAVYSSSTIRPHLYKTFPDYNERRLAQKISVRAIAIGAGGKEAGLDKRRWLTRKESAPTYTLIYAGKIGMISVSSKNEPHGLIIEDKNLYETELLVFNHLWDALEQK